MADPWDDTSFGTAHAEMDDVFGNAFGAPVLAAAKESMTPRAEAAARAAAAGLGAAPPPEHTHQHR